MVKIPTLRIKIEQQQSDYMQELGIYLSVSGDGWRRLNACFKETDDLYDLSDILRANMSVSDAVAHSDKIEEKHDVEAREADTPTNAKWGYAVCIGTIVTFIAGIGHVNSFGLIYNDFISDTHSTANSLTTSHGVFAIMLAIGGIILNVITRTKSLRFGGLIGASLCVLGSFLTILISNTNQLPFTFGVLQGIGFGMMVPVCYATINYYYVKRRTTVMSICKAVQSAIQMIYPQAMKELLYEYGFRGTLIIISGISLHTIPGMLLMVKEWRDHSRTRIAKNVEEGDAIVEKNNLLQVNGEQRYADVPRTKKKNRRYKILEILHLKIMKDSIFMNICLCQSFINFSDLAFFMLQPMLLFQYGYDKTEVAACISIGAGADLAGRCVLAVISSFTTVNTRTLFYFSSLLTLFFRIAMLQTEKFPWMAAITGVLGVLRSWLHIASPLNIASHVKREDFPGAYALFMLTAGVVNVTVGPLIGLLKDISGDYVYSFYALTVCFVPCLICWPIEYLIKIKTLSRT